MASLLPKSVREKPWLKKDGNFSIIANELDKDVRKDTAMSHKRKRHSSVWRTFGTEMKIDPRFARAGFLGIGLAALFVTLYALSGLEIFRWLTYVSGAVLIVITLLTLIAGIEHEN